jgi:hypothetical protein
MDWPDMTWQDVVRFYSIANEIEQELDKLDRDLLKCRSEIQLQMIMEEPDLWLVGNDYRRS